MSRSRKRVCLEHGSKLALNYLFRHQYIRIGVPIGPKYIGWSDSISRQILSSGYLTANVAESTEGWLRIEVDGQDQKIKIVPKARNFGGYQWYFVCPLTGHLATVLWKPPGADRFYSRRAWGMQVAYLSQFGSWIDRAHAGKAKIRAKLLGDCDPNGDLPPRPRGMKVQTYNRFLFRFNAYQSLLSAGLNELAVPPELDE
jgi:hypothetical protein